MQELTFILDDLRGEIIVEDNEHLDAETLRTLENHLGKAQEIACARPLEILPPPPNIPIKDVTESQFVRIAGFYHNSLTEGPGRRSSVLFQFCLLKCKGFIYSLNWEKYYITHDRTEPTTYCHRSASRTMA